MQTVAQSEDVVRAYIEQYKKIAVEEMLEYGIPASITIAQGIHESAAGKSKLALNSNNHFGIKCHKDWSGKGYKHDDDKPQECFRVYNNPEESYRDHSLFLKGRRWYNPLFELPHDDYKGWAKGLKKAGYATNPHYAEILIGLIEKYNLSNLDKLSPEDLAEMKKRTDDPIVIPEDISASVGKHFHHVEQGESLYGIARKYNITVEDIQRANKLINTHLYIGQKLMIVQ